MVGTHENECGVEVVHIVFSRLPLVHGVEVDGVIGLEA